MWQRSNINLIRVSRRLLGRGQPSRCVLLQPNSISRRNSAAASQMPLCHPGDFGGKNKKRQKRKGVVVRRQRLIIPGGVVLISYPISDQLCATELSGHAQPPPQPRNEDQYINFCSQRQFGVKLKKEKKGHKIESNYVKRQNIYFFLNSTSSYIGLFLLYLPSKEASIILSLF